MSVAPQVTTENAIVAGELGDGAEVSIGSACTLFAIEGKAPCQETVRGWMCHGFKLGEARVRLASRKSHVGLVTTEHAIRCFKQSLELPRGVLVDHLRDSALRAVAQPDLPSDVIAMLGKHGIALPGQTNHADEQCAGDATDASAQQRPSPASEQAQAG